MAVTITRPSGRRADDVRALKFRFRTLTFTGNYATGGEVLTSRSLGFYRVIGVVLLDSVIGDPAGVTGVTPKIIVSSDGRTVTIKSMEDAAGAAGTTIGQEKTNAEAYVANSKIDVLLIGEG